ncbi:UNVERIFIED_CONTAM: hypothetical protein FKN15_049327 [Acipenser sinensis]
MLGTIPQRKDEISEVQAVDETLHKVAPVSGKACEGETSEAGVEEKVDVNHEMGTPERENDAKETMLQEDFDLELLPIEPTSEPQGKVSVFEKKQDTGTKTGRGRKDKADRVPLKKPWDTKQPRARSKSRERTQTKPKNLPNDQINVSIGSNDAYDFNCEEVIHMTPFRSYNKPSEEEEDTVVNEADPGCASEDSSDSESSSSEDLDCSIYEPGNRKGKKNKQDSSHLTEKAEIPPRRPRSKRRSIVQSWQRSGKENVDAGSNEAISAVADMEVAHKMENPLYGTVFNRETVEYPGGEALCDVTNISSASREKELKTSSTLLNIKTEKPATPVRKRRCTLAVSYKEPTLNAKLRRGDKFTDTEFLHSPVFKQECKRKSIKTEKFVKYNESFVGCRP